ncbi:hypothetical protein HHK36_023195 [Tetracentron sinense]|uniref:Phosphoglycerate kinase n=1 Tax=Tetracentron sinense TaxID=13715 RepID=A0A834YQ05_TETSI|nr:hypothetical protein HHK36_023195 [Tetracentron sinense]
MASATSHTSLSLLPSTSRSRSSLQAVASISSSHFQSVGFRAPLRRLGFSGTAVDPLLVLHVAAKIRGVGIKGVRGVVVSMAKKSVGDLKSEDLKGKKVFVRADLNVPLDDNQNITDDTRIRAAVPTIKHLIGKGAKVILSSHLGRPKGVTPKYSLTPLVPRLSELLGIKVEKADDCIGPEVEKMVAALPEGSVLLLENVRFYKEEEKNDPEFAKKLASLADLYVNDAFGTAHRAHASTEGVTKFLNPSVAGFLLQKELDYLVGAVSNPKRPFAAIVGGSKVSSMIGVIESLLEKCDILLLGGGMIFTFYKAQGLSVGSSLVEEDKLALATSLLEKAKLKGVSLLLPTDVIVAASGIPDGWMGLDIGPDSIKTFSDALATTKTVIWNGPMGVFEFDKFAVGTEVCRNCLPGHPKSVTSKYSLKPIVPRQVRTPWSQVWKEASFSFADLYANDAFGTAHRAHASHASIEEVTKFLKPSVAGFLTHKVAQRYHPMIFTFYKAQQGHLVGSSLVEEDMYKLDLATSLLETAKSKGVSLLLPTDVFIIDKFAADHANNKVCSYALLNYNRGLGIVGVNINRN